MYIVMTRVIGDLMVYLFLHKPIAFILTTKSYVKFVKAIPRLFSSVLTILAHVAYVTGP